jgi:hypothetical protein
VEPVYRKSCAGRQRNHKACRLNVGVTISSRITEDDFPQALKLNDLQIFLLSHIGLYKCAAVKKVVSLNYITIRNVVKLLSRMQ